MTYFEPGDLNPGRPNCLPDPTDAPDPCEIGEHPDQEDGYCLLCGEYIGPEDAEEFA